MLVDSNDIVERHWRIWADRRGVSFDKIARSHHGRPTAQTIQDVAPELDVAAEALEKERLEADDTNGLVAFPGAHRLLSAIPKERWAIVTSGTRRTATTRLTFTLLPAPKTFITADDVQHGKPDPEPYRKAIEQLGFPASRCVVIEDAPAGIESARTAGASVIAITSTNPKSALVAANTVVDCLDDLSVQRSGEELRIVIGPDSSTK